MIYSYASCQCTQMFHFYLGLGLVHASGMESNLTWVEFWLLIEHDAERIHAATPNSLRIMLVELS